MAAASKEQLGELWVPNILQLCHMNVADTIKVDSMCFCRK